MRTLRQQGALSRQRRGGGILMAAGSLRGTHKDSLWQACGGSDYVRVGVCTSLHATTSITQPVSQSGVSPSSQGPDRMTQRAGEQRGTAAAVQTGHI